MIRSICNNDKINALNPFGIRIKALHNAYADTGICSFYIDTDSSCLMAQSGNTLIIDGEALPDNQLLYSFCRMVGADTLLCSGELKHTFHNAVQGKILKYIGKNAAVINDNTVAINSNLRVIYPLLNNNFKGMAAQASFDEFYVDISHRVRHGCACASIVYDKDGKPVSCAVAPFVCNDGAVISAVCTDNNSRGKGYATQAVSALLRHLQDCRIDGIYLQTEDDSLLDFYYPLGFNVSGVWQEIRFD